MMWRVVWLKIPMNPNSATGSGFWLDILNGPRFGEVERNLVGNYDGEVLGRSNGVLIGRSEKAFHSDHQTAPGSGDM